MKLSKNRLHKIKGKKNSSRKKNNFRKRKGKKSYENTKKRHKRTHNLRKKTLKIYVGGADKKVCKFKNESNKIKEQLNPENFVKKSVLEDKNNLLKSNY